MGAKQLSLPRTRYVGDYGCRASHALRVRSRYHDYDIGEEPHHHQPEAKDHS
ncbi:hypothetical protein [Aneurinibacillus aneurinilyticus]|uniref:hypothetical protein n=1 Tax=Aneurinibacillus aneurinilyticus TaxID=1391 RepID=UPI0012DCDC05|nr:hypothetical protein [Aneurinibacillus aneurinilyticus]MCI1696150.1 hypothetical protein [Aneurinibacillus aneurinilyticus]MED0705092.1 hypothetical protein [Aneurinibacillus aneurinilyticus]MED0724265.1 hypothetical protein [Aneurinibacillus aneurinilyticus]MED0733073.1 hypothetical protein [Aneurinibacillus aneurinilyticus]MED0743891.1 hypothetical protein [Aneurinibacillus aneurinilyticus]